MSALFHSEVMTMTIGQLKVQMLTSASNCQRPSVRQLGFCTRLTFLECNAIKVPGLAALGVYAY